MNCKPILLALFLLTAIPALAQHPADRPAALWQFGQYYQPYFEQAFKQFEITNDTAYTKDYIVDVYFIIDTTGSPKNIKMNKNDCPTRLTDDILKMIRQTSNNWQPAIRNCQKVTSDIIHCRFQLYSNAVTPAQRMDTIENELSKEYYAGQENYGKKEVNVTNYIFLKIGTTNAKE